MKHLPNAISALRFLGAVCLLFFGVESCAFWAIYFGCGLSDMADGYLARKLECESKVGALLDSLADLVFGRFGFCGLLLLYVDTCFGISKMVMDLGRSDCRHQGHQSNLCVSDVQEMYLSSHHCK